MKKIFLGFIVVAIMLGFMLTSPNLTGMSVGIEQQDTTCDSPYMEVGDSCCMDQNSNSICDENEIQTQDEIVDIPNETIDKTIETETQNEVGDTCSSPYMEVGDSCCMDQNSNSICDENEIQTQDETPNTPQEETVEEPVQEKEPVCVIGPPKIPENPEYYYEGWVDPPGFSNCYEACHMCYYVKDTHGCIDNICWKLLGGLSCEAWFPMECKKQ